MDNERQILDKFVVFNEYDDQYFTTGTLQGAKNVAKANIGEMYSDGGGDSGCEQIIYERKGIIIGSMAVTTEEIWDKEET